MEEKKTKKGFNIKFKKCYSDVEIPKYAHEGDLGLDMVAREVTYDPEYDAYIYDTCICSETKKRTGLFAFCRSSNYRTDCYLTNSVGVLDTAIYRGSIKAIFKNRLPFSSRVEQLAFRKYLSLPWYKRIFANYSDIYNEVQLSLDPMDFAPYQVGDKIIQLLPYEHDTVNIRETKKLSETVRGSGGFGSTGK